MTRRPVKDSVEQRWIPVFMWLRQEGQSLEANLGYIVTACLKTNKKVQGQAPVFEKGGCQGLGTVLWRQKMQLLLPGIAEFGQSSPCQGSGDARKLVSFKQKPGSEICKECLSCERKGYKRSFFCCCCSIQ